MATATPLYLEHTMARIVTEAEIDAAIDDAEMGPEERAQLRHSTFLRGIIRDTLEMPPPPPEQQTRSRNICRLAAVLADMTEREIGPEELGEDAIAWKDRPDFEQLLDAWEAGQHPLQLAHR
jgi:hypothetical protein